ncbi:hypothetical protein [Tsukamurella soli]|uniref:hypothetical protein n=1 Tax=Tsukamurella soli TaxID=644556 RepID=UPI00361DB787
MTVADRGRAALYQAESMVRGLFEHAQRAPGRAVDVCGIALTLPPEARFASLESVQRYVDDALRVLGRPAEVRVRARAGVAGAHYEPVPPVIAVPTGAGERGRCARPWCCTR